MDDGRNVHGQVFDLPEASAYGSGMNRRQEDVVVEFRYDPASIQVG